MATVAQRARQPIFAQATRRERAENFERYWTYLQEKKVAMAGLVSAFIFAVQMLNFPVASGTSGHLLGGLLAAVLVGQWVGALCVSVVRMRCDDDD